jgi:hypothetical protein
VRWAAPPVGRLSRFGVATALASRWSGRSAWGPAGGTSSSSASEAFCGKNIAEAYSFRTLGAFCGQKRRGGVLLSNVPQLARGRPAFLGHPEPIRLAWSLHPPVASPVAFRASSVSLTSPAAASPPESLRRGGASTSPQGAAVASRVPSLFWLLLSFAEEKQVQACLAGATAEGGGPHGGVVDQHRAGEDEVVSNAWCAAVLGLGGSGA